MSSVAVIPKVLLSDLEQTCCEVRNLLRDNPETVDLAPLEQLIEKIKRANFKPNQSFWDTKRGERTFKACQCSNYVSIGVGSVAIPMTQFITSINSNAECIRTLISTNSLNNDTDAIIDFCEDSIPVQYTVFFGGLIAGAVMTIFAIMDSKKNQHEEKEKELLQEIRSAEQEEKFAEFLKTLNELKERHEKPQFDACIASVKAMQKQSNPYFSKLGTTEDVVSSLVQLVKDDGLQETLNDAVTFAKTSKSKRRKVKRLGRGERAAPDSSKKTFNQIWNKIESFVQIPLEGLRIGQSYITKDGKLKSLKKIVKRPVFDVREPETV